MTINPTATATAERRAIRAYTFPNGMMIVFDQHGEQMPAYQGRADEYLPKLNADFPACAVVPARWDGKRENPIVPLGEE